MAFQVMDVAERDIEVWVVSASIPGQQPARADRTRYDNCRDRYQPG